jgi:hypothetical protein
MSVGIADVERVRDVVIGEVIRDPGILERGAG